MAVEKHRILGSPVQTASLLAGTLDRECPRPQGTVPVFTAGLGFPTSGRQMPGGPRRPPTKGPRYLRPLGTACPNLRMITPRPAGPDPQPPHFHVTKHGHLSLRQRPMGGCPAFCPPNTPLKGTCACHPQASWRQSPPRDLCSRRLRRASADAACCSSFPPLPFQNKKPGSSESLL